ncbi:MAG: two-component system, OmpR family, sensor kinase [Actinomycetota bacterium]|nr:two-component system, OmpR family, sensor kinase [Actinomycetota bacterium]
MALILLVAAVVIGGAGVLIVTGIERRLVAGVDRELASRGDAVAPKPGHDDHGPSPAPGPHHGEPGAEPSPFDVRRYAFVNLDRDGRVVSTVTSGPDDDPDPLPDVSGLKAPAGPLTVPGVAGDLRYRVVMIPQADGGAVAAGIPLTDVEQAVGAARDIVLVSGLVAVALVGLVVWFMVRRSLRPIDQMIVSAERIAAGELSERAPVPQPASEVGHLGTALNLMLDRIEEAVDAKTASEARTRRFAADASHELRTPLTSIRGYAELYRQGARSPAEVALAMGRIEHEAVRMGDLVGDLLLLARLDQGRPLEREPVDLTGLVLDAVAAAKAVEPGRAIRVDVGDHPVTVLGDPHRLRQIVDNLLANVRDHTGPDTSVTVTLSVAAAGGRATRVVSDDGPGMSADDGDRAFDRFWQAEGDSAAVSGTAARGGQRGTGLGLSIVAEIVAAHGGDILLDTAPGAGATFTITLPVRG